MSRVTLITRDDTNAIQPDKIKLKLKDHQLKLLKKCIELESDDIIYSQNNNIKIKTKIGIIGSTVGSGKSISILALITHPISIRHYPIYKTFNDYFNIEDNSLTSYNYIDKNINVIVIPHNIFMQWKVYIELQTILTVEYYRVAADKIKLKFNKELILVSSSQYNNFAEFVNEGRFRFSRIFYDEADSINIPNCRKINAMFYWFVTSSIENLITPKGLKAWNNTLRKYTVVHPGIKCNGLIKDTFKSLIDVTYKKDIFLKNDDILVKESFALPDLNLIKYLCKNTAILNVLNNLVSENIQQMICAGDIEGAIKSMNVEKTNETNLIKIVCNTMYDEIENKEIDLEAIRKKTYVNKEAQENHIIKIKKEILEIKSKINSIRTRIKETNMDPITFCEIDNPTIVKCCNQVFDFESITIYLTTTNNPHCPMCRTPIKKESLIIIDSDDGESKTDSEDNEEIEYKFEDNDKLDNFEYILNNINKNAKIIIFSEHDGTFNNITSILDKMKITFKQLKGNTYCINKILEWFKEPDNIIKVLFLNARFAGAGLNLQCTTDLIIYHKMTKELETQVIGRAQRPGRTDHLNVHQLLYNDE